MGSELHRQLAVFIDDALPEHRARWAGDESFAARLDWQRRLHAGGWVGITWAPDMGGRGATPAERVRCDLVAAEAGAPRIAGIIGVNNVGPAIAAHGSDAQRASLPRILAGDEIWCQGFSEPDAGSDLARLRTRALVVDDGFMVTGAKVWTSTGLDASHCMFLARTDPDAPGHAGISALVMPMDRAGLEVRPIRQMDGDADFAELHLDDVRLPRSALLGPLHGGWRVAMGTLAHERAGVVALASEVVAAVDVLVRRQLPLTVAGSARADRLVQEWIQAQVLRHLASRVLGALSRGEDPSAEQSLLKLAWSSARQRSSVLAVDELGPAGLLDGDDLAATGMLTARAATIAAGTTEVLKNVVGERVLGLAK